MSINISTNEILNRRTFLLVHLTVSISFLAANLLQIKIMMPVRTSKYVDSVSFGTFAVLMEIVQGGFDVSIMYIALVPQCTSIQAAQQK